MGSPQIRMLDVVGTLLIRISMIGWARFSRHGKALLIGFSFLFVCNNFAHAQPQIGTKGLSDDRPHILFILDADSEKDALWYQSLVNNSQLAANAFDINLEIFFVGTTRTGAMERLTTRLGEGPKPDYMVFGNQRGLATKFLGLADHHQIKTFLSIAPLNEEEYEQVGRPRENYKYWIGELIPNDEQAGYDQAMQLIAAARKRNAENDITGPITIIGFTGRRSSTVSQARQAGLIRAVNDSDDVKLLQTLPARWRRDISAKKFRLLQNRYDRIDIVWCANDSIAMGVLDALDGEVDIPAIGGVDWIASVREALLDGRMVTSMGGQDFDIAYVMVLLRHYHDGRDFADIVNTPSLQSQLFALTSENIADYAAFLKDRETGKLDVKRGFSGLLNDPEALRTISIRRFIDQSMATPSTVRLRRAVR